MDAGCRTVYLNGSFVTSKTFPNDYDACWEEAGVDPAALDPVLLTFDPGRATQKAKYMGELYPASIIADAEGLSFLEFFQTDKDTGMPKGILAIDLGGLVLSQLRFSNYLRKRTIRLSCLVGSIDSKVDWLLV